MRRLPVVLLLALVPGALASTDLAAQTAQGARTVPDSVFARAQRLVTGGNGTDGRALVDSVLGAVRPGSADHAEALYWRAALAETAAEAERAYLRLVVEYPLAPRTDAALFRLGQLELTRGNESVARGRFERIATEFPESPLVGRAQLSLARLHLEARRMPQACAAVGAGKTAAPAADVELVNQLSYLEQQCRAAGVATTGAAPATVAAAERPAPARAPAPRAATATAAAAADTADVEPTPPRRDTARVTPPRRDTVRATPPAATRPATTPATRPAPSATRPAPATAPTRATPAPTRPAATRPATAASTAAASAPAFSVQVAAFDRAEPATAFVAELTAAGLEARVDRDARWHRVRIGRYATRAEAAAAARRLAARDVTGFVVGVGGR